MQQAALLERLFTNMACTTCDNAANAQAQSTQWTEAASKFAALPTVKLRYMGQRVAVHWLGRYEVGSAERDRDTFVASIDVAALLNVVADDVRQFMFIERAKAEQWLALSGAGFALDAICIEPPPPPPPPPTE